MVDAAALLFNGDTSSDAEAALAEAPAAEVELAAPVAVKEAVTVEADASAVVSSVPSSSPSSHSSPSSESSPSSALALDVAEADAAAEVAATVSVEDATAGAEETAELEPEAEEVVEFDPSMPPETPVASIRANASDWLSQDKLVPAELTRGRAKHDVPLEHSVTSHVPPTH